MNFYIQPTPNPSGAYPPPQSNPVPGLAPISAELTAQLLACNGFGTLTMEGGAVTAVTPNQEAWEAWKAAQPTGEPEAAPTDSERLDALELAMLELAEVIANG